MPLDRWLLLTALASVFGASSAGQELCSTSVDQAKHIAESHSLLQAKQDLVPLKSHPREEAEVHPTAAPLKQPKSLQQRLAEVVPTKALRRLRPVLPWKGQERLALLVAKSWQPAAETVVSWEGPGPQPSHPAPKAPTFLSEFLGGLVYMVLVVVIAYAYVAFGWRQASPQAGSSLKPPGIEEQAVDGFHFGMLDCDGCCGRDALICLCGCCCTSIRWADTMSQDKLKFGYNFWALLLLYLTLASLLDAPTLGISALLLLCVAVSFRQRLRQTYGLKHGTCCSIFGDVLAWIFCIPCAAIQEAREVEYISLPA